MPSSKIKVSIWRADVTRVASGPLLVPFPKLVVISRGAPYKTSSEFLNEILSGTSAKLVLASVLSGIVNIDSIKWRTSFKLDDIKLEKAVFNSNTVPVVCM